LDAAGKNSEATAKAYKLLEHNPEETRAVFLLAVSAMRRNRRELAKFHFEKLEKDRNFPWRSLLFNNLGMIALKENDRNRAIEYFEKAVDAKPEIPAPLVNLGSIYLQSHHYSKARSMFEEAVELDGNFEDAHLGLGVSLAGLGRHDKAHSVFSGYLSSHPNALSLLYNDAILLAKHLKKKNKARAKMMRYIKKGGKETAKAQKLIQKWR